MYDGYRAPIEEEWLAKIREYYRETYGEDSDEYRVSQSGPFGGGPYSGALTWEPHVGESKFEELVAAESNLTLIRGYYPDAVERANRRLQAIYFRSFQTQKRIRISADIFIDTTYEADAAALAGVPYRIGREDRNEYNEIYAGKIFVKRSGDEGQFVVDDYDKLQYPHSARAGKLNVRPWWGTMQEIFSESTGEGDGGVQAYNFRVCLSRDPGNRVTVEPLEGYNRNDFLPIVEKERQDAELYPHPIKSGLLNYPLISFPAVIPIPNKKCDWNAAAIPGGVDEYPDGNWETRERILKRHREFAFGLLYFLQNDEAVPEKVRNEANQWGFPKDEFQDNDHFPHEFYAREGRRIVGRYVFREQDACIGRGLRRAPVHYDAIAIADWFMDSHDCSPERIRGAEGDGFTCLSEFSRPSQIPYRTLLSNDIDNLIIGLAVSATHVAWGSIRVEPCYMHIAESAGYAAAMAVDKGIAPTELRITSLQRKLAESRIMLSFFNEFDMESEQPWVPAVQYLGTKGFFGSYFAWPERPLTEAVARLWAKAFGDMLDGNLDASRYACNVAEAELKDSKCINAKTFADLLQREADYRELAQISIESKLSEVALEGKSELSRGSTSLLVYSLLSHIDTE